MYKNFELILGDNIKNASILDVGCGWGLALLYLKKKVYNVKVSILPLKQWTMVIKKD